MLGWMFTSLCLILQAMAEKEPKSSTEPLEGGSPEVRGHDETDSTLKKKSKSKKPKQDPRLIVDGEWAVSTVTRGMV